MPNKPTKAVLMQTLFVNGGRRLQKGIEAELLCCNDTDAVITVDGCSMFLPRHSNNPNSDKTHQGRDSWVFCPLYPQQ